MKNLLSHLTTFIYAVLAGVAISIGGAAFLASDSRAVGASLFSVGLFAVCTLGLNLFTGKICYALDNPPAYLLNCGLIWLGNFLGAWLSGSALALTRLDWAEKAGSICQAKLADSPLSLFILAVFCNILIYFAVESYRNNPHSLGKYLGLFLGVAVFVMVGFEHCVANMFYFSVAGVWNGQALLAILIITVGNATGGLIFPLCRKLQEHVKGESK